MNTEHPQAKPIKLFLFAPILMLLFAQLSQAQLSISATDFPGKDDTVRYSNSNSFFTNFTATGANFTWNFANLGAQSQTLVKHLDPDQADVFTQSLFGSAVLPTYRATYFLPARELPLATVSNIVDLPIEEIYRFFRKTNQEMTVVGLSISAGGFAVGKRADTIEIAYKFPMTFGQTYSSNGYVNLDFSAFAPFALKQYRQRTSEVDGWGTITTPYGTFECLRIHHVIQELDSILVDLGQGPQWTPIDIPTINEYEWWTKDQKGPVLKVKANEIFGFPVVNEIQFRDKYRPELNVGIDQFVNQELIIFPNPATDMIQVQYDKPNAEVVITDALGKVVLMTTSLASIDISSLHSGVYFLRINEGENGYTTSFPFIKQ
jgi:hypothetical protein